MNQKSLEKKCAHCGEIFIWNKDARFRPFCSERCRSIDLGHWLSESYAIPGKDLSLVEDVIEDEENKTEADNDFE